ncbi:MAG: hypothetical protein IJO57_04315 [Bacilli bacterium]|nr:hypothetical protein [Bacilli bacterium]
MKYKRYLLLLLLIIVIPINKAYADCKEELKEIEDIKDEFQITYEYVPDVTEYGGYILTFYNPNKDKYYYDMFKPDNLECIEENEYYTKCYYYFPTMYSSEIRSTNKLCKESLHTVFIDLPYNEFSKDQVCEGIEDFVLCKPTYDKEIDYETFLQRVEVYKKTLTELEEKEESKLEEPIIEKTTSEKIIDYIMKNIFIIVTMIVATILLIILIVYMIKKHRERWRLE